MNKRGKNADEPVFGSKPPIRVVFNFKVLVGLILVVVLTGVIIILLLLT